MLDLPCSSSWSLCLPQSPWFRLRVTKVQSTCHTSKLACIPSMLLILRALLMFSANRPTAGDLVYFVQILEKCTVCLYSGHSCDVESREGYLRMIAPHRSHSSMAGRPRASANWLSD